VTAISEIVIIVGGKPFGLPGGELTKERIMPLGMGLADLLEDHQGDRLESITFEANGVTHEVLEAPIESLDEDSAADAGTAFVRKLDEFTKRRRRRGNA
jgi:hypothetical protein